MQYKDFKNVQVMEHPLIKHKISLLRDVSTGTHEFRQLVEEIATLEGYEALRDLPLKDVEIQTPLEKTMTPMIDGKKLAIVPILRAGLGMVPGVEALVPLAKVATSVFTETLRHTSLTITTASFLIPSISVSSLLLTLCLLQAVQQLMPSIRSRLTAERTSSSCASLQLP